MADTKPNNTEEQKRQSTLEWAKEKYNEQYDSWMPWIEDVFLKYFTKDNRTSYVARDQLDKTKVTGVQQVDKLQDGANDLAANQIGQGGVLQPVGDLASEGMKLVDPRGKGRGKSGDDNKSPNVPIVSGLGL
ncbi:hypothetical protein O1611_g1826 [Lasiodiplodia mahajangana]|uniref:Uncharacterized protein n=1 Tax=Lasiodiplodia mahajangana TaxID=1108764 RepID=A0ACC2JWW7_9PEZI|nr:hypothetical protein O1611_g1826 [Lasiodiplodia mahajangana]